MVRKIKVIDVYDTEPEANTIETNEPTNTEADTAQVSEAEEPPLEASAATEQPSEEPVKKPMLNMPTTQKVLQQVECQACKRKMPAKTLKYKHAQYCTAREKEEHPEEIPIPKLEIKNGGHLKNTASLPVKKGKLKRSKPITKEVFEGEATDPASTPAPPQQIDLSGAKLLSKTEDQSFHFQMRERLQQKEAKYQVMMSNAF